MMSLVHELEDNINNLTMLEFANKLYERYKEEYRKLIFTTGRYREKKLTYFHVLAYEISVHAQNKLLESAPSSLLKNLIESVESSREKAESSERDNEEKGRKLESLESDNEENGRKL